MNFDRLEEIVEKGTPNLSNDFNKEYIKVVKRLCKPYNLEVVNPTKGYCECSGFIKSEDDKYVYFNSGDFRWTDVFDDVLIRSAESENDYRGGRNQRCRLEDIGWMAERIMGD